MYNHFLYYSFFTLGFIQLTWFLGYKKYTSNKQTMILTLLLCIEFIATIFNISSSDWFFLLYFILQPIFVLFHVHSWILMTLFLFLNNSFIILSWLFTYDFLKLLFETHCISTNLFQQYVPIAIFFQQLLLFFLIQSFNYLDKRFSIFDSISRIHKKYKFQSIIGIIFLIILSTARRIIVNGRFTESFFYITVVLLFLNFIVYLTAYIYSQYSQQILEKNILARQFNQEVDKINLSNEFRHDYRNILLSLNSYIQNGEAKEALDFISSVVNYSQPLLEDSPYEQIARIEVPAIQGLLITFIDLAEKEGISFKLSIPTPIKEVNISIKLADFIQSLSTLLHYALQEHNSVLLTLKKENKQIIIELNNTPTNSFSNNFKQDKKHIKKAGLQPIKNMLNKYKNTSFSFYCKDTKFLVQFAFPLN